MKLPNADRAVITQQKLADYLLNSAHPDNGGKGPFFRSLGFVSEEWESLAAALRRAALLADVTETVESSHGTKYILDARIDSPSGKSPFVRTVWIIDRGQSLPRLVTAYPQPEMNL